MKTTTPAPVTTSPVAHCGLVPALLARWPAALALLALAANVSGGADAHSTAFIIVIAATCYLGAAVVGRPRSGWLMVLVCSGVVVGAGLAGLDPTVAVLVLGAVLAIVGLVRPGADRGEVARQTVAFLGFGAVAVAAMLTGPLPAALLGAGVAVGHAAWDVWHVLRGRVVTRSLAEACFLLDLGLGLALVLVAVAA